MATGHPKKYATARIKEPIPLSTPGIEVVIWDKWGKKRRGRVVVSVGGIRWYPYMAKKPHKLTWNQFDQLFDNRKK